MSNMDDMDDTSQANVDTVTQQEVEGVRRSQRVKIPSKRLTDFVEGVAGK